MTERMDPYELFAEDDWTVETERKRPRERVRDELPEPRDEREAA